jgi:hypothetical protein
MFISSIFLDISGYVSGRILYGVRDGKVNSQTVMAVENMNNYFLNNFTSNNLDFNIDHISFVQKFCASIRRRVVYSSLVPSASTNNSSGVGSILPSSPHLLAISNQDLVDSNSIRFALRRRCFRAPDGAGEVASDSQFRCDDFLMLSDDAEIPTIKMKKGHNFCSPCSKLSFSSSKKENHKASHILGKDFPHVCNFSLCGACFDKPYLLRYHAKLCDKGTSMRSVVYSTQMAEGCCPPQRYIFLISY